MYATIHIWANIIQYKAFDTKLRTPGTQADNQDLHHFNYRSHQRTQAIHDPDDPKRSDVYCNMFIKEHKVGVFTSIGTNRRIYLSNISQRIDILDIQLEGYVSKSNNYDLQN